VEFLLVFGGVCVALVLCEVALRFSGFSVPNLYIRDPEVGTALRPNAEGWWTREGRSYVRINSQGLRDREHTKQKPANTLRIAVLGDSYAEALQVAMEKAFWAVAEAKLRDCPAVRGNDVEVINFGVSGYGAAQELLTLRHKVWDYDPDIVLLTMTTRNDVGDNSRVIKQSDDVPYFVLSNGQLVLDGSFRDTPTYRLRDSTLYASLRWARDHSRVVQAIYAALHAMSVWRQGRANRSGSDANLDDYKEPETQAWRDAWAVTEALLVRMRDDVEAKHARLFVVTLSGPRQIDPDPQLRQEIMIRSGISDFFYPDLRIGEFCRRQSIPALILAPRMYRYAVDHNVYLHGFSNGALGRGHWNELGHQLAGEMIAGWLCERLTGERQVGSGATGR
jgi:hypothetical protein